VDKMKRKQKTFYEDAKKTISQLQLSQEIELGKTFEDISKIYGIKSKFISKMCAEKNILANSHHKKIFLNNMEFNRNMNIYKYIEKASRNCPDLGGDLNNQLHMAIGASTEANELLDAYKKWFAYGKPLDKINVSEEIFDCFWYLLNLCRMLEIDPEKGMDTNIAKLQARYPEKFTEYYANNRDLEKERKILEE